ncbi:hypothetical protein DF188_05885 [Aliarcobacter skirrowii]|uniref:Sulfotransferase domain-containing protein n=1 Tax=Aliarcobacter skirrowii TaxID=28200 RepID=A0A2U2C139_9BACT|nr:hypothetical protein [Aliarcobacter skirrowii]PWE21742.1 hypothetical protein DF188_05885 [Aliarcobacter skirrowii]
MTKQIFLHIGLPKTATSAFQHWCYDNKDELKKYNIEYSSEVNLASKNHQFIRNAFMYGNFDKLVAILENIKADKILLSHEGLSNRFIDFEEKNFMKFREIVKDYEVNIFLVTREYNSWIKSYYKQSIVNPSFDGLYSTKEEIEEFKNEKIVQTLTTLPNRLGFIKEKFGAKNIYTFKYEDDWMSEIGKVIGYPFLSIKNVEKKHESISDEIVMFIREVNRLNLSIELRNTMLYALRNVIKTNHITLTRYLNFKTTNKDALEVIKILETVKFKYLSNEIKHEMIEVLNEIK